MTEFFKIGPSTADINGVVHRMVGAPFPACNVGNVDCVFLDTDCAGIPCARRPLRKLGYTVSSDVIWLKVK